MKSELSDKQEAFCREYLIDFNATQAAIRAGYAEKSANMQGCRLLTNDNVSARISELSKNVIDNNEVTIERIIQEYANIAFLDPIEIFDENGNLKPLDKMSESARRAISGIKIRVERDQGEAVADVTEVKIIDKKAALADLGKHLGMFIDRIDHSSSDGSMSPTKIEIVAPEPE